MKVSEVISTVMSLQADLIDVDNLSTEYELSVLTNGGIWIVKLFGEDLVSSEEFDDERPLREQILEGMQEIQIYLNLVLKKWTTPHNKANPKAEEK